MPTCNGRVGDIPTTDERKESWETFRGETPMQKALANLGLTPEKAADCMLQELEATSVKAQVVDDPQVTTAEDGTNIVVNHKKWAYSKPLIDWPTRQRARQDLQKCWGSIPKSQNDNDTELNINIKTYAGEAEVPSDGGENE